MKINFMKKQIKLLSILALGIGMSANADAQVAYPYVVDFEAASMNPSSKTSYAGADTFTINGLKWVVEGAVIGTPQTGTPSPDFFIDNRSIRLRLANNTSGNQGYMTMIEDLPLGADSLTFHTAMYGTDTGDSVLVQYSTNQGATWTSVNNGIAVTGTNTNGQEVKLNPAINSPVRFRFSKVKGTSVRVNLDNIYFTAATQATNMVLMSTNPTGTVHPNNVDKLVLKFNDAIDLGTGNIVLQEVGGAAQTFDVATSSDVSVTDSMVEVANITLIPSASYFVTFDSTAFEGVNSGLLSTGIYDSLTWTFNTSALALNDFTEDFTNCNGAMLGAFIQQSVSGIATWKCDTYNDTLGSFDPPYVVMNGGTGAEVFENVDYLITALPIDFGDLGNDQIRKANLSYQEKRRFGGDKVTRGIYYSTDYAGDAATATWIAIDNNLPAIASTGQFFDKSIDITSAAAENKPFFLAFKYETTPDTTNNAWEWALDNIEVTHADSTLSINNIFKKQVNLTVLGEATSNQINLRVSTLKNLDLNIAIFDMNGRQIFNKAAFVTTGTQVVELNNTNIAQGMYLIRVASKEGSQAIKVMVH